MNKKVLIVDDNPMNIKILTRLISNFNFDVDSCLDGLECLTKINSGNIYDLILMDIMMPNMDGVACIQALHALPGFNTPIIAVTADAVEGSKEKYLSVGFDDYISKPTDKILLHDAIRNVLFL